MKSHCRDVTLLGLTATASLNVLKDLQVEMGVDDSNDVRTLPDYGREELTFEVIDDGGRKLDCLTERIKLFKTEQGLEQSKESINLKKSNVNCRLIFTPYVNGGKGCYEVANSLTNALSEIVRWYSGSRPKNAIIAEKEFDAHKQAVQDDFKNDKFSLLVATKAFGMGIRAFS